MINTNKKTYAFYNKKTYIKIINITEGKEEPEIKNRITASQKPIYYIKIKKEQVPGQICAVNCV